MASSKEQLEIGRQIAEKHMKNVLMFINELGTTPQQALEGNLVALAADIMIALDDPERLYPTMAKTLGDMERKKTVTTSPDSQTKAASEDCQDAPTPPATDLS